MKERDEKFMEGEWERLAAFYGVSVEELKSEDFDRRLELEQQEEDKKRNAEYEKQKKQLNRECINCIVAGCVIAFVLAPFAGWYAIAVGLVAAYQLCNLVCEIADERNDRKRLAWEGFGCASLIFLAAILAVAARQST